MEEFVFECRCGEKLKVEGGSNPSSGVLVVVCDRCWLNHRLEWVEGVWMVTMRYYFPDD